MTDNPNHLPEWVRCWMLLRRSYPGKDWIIRGRVSICIGALPGYALPAGNDNAAS